MAVNAEKSRPEPKTGTSAQQLLLARFLADLLDQRFTIPGTSIRVGLDPIIGLIPGIGDVISNVAGSAILVIAARLGLPKAVLIRMGLNIAANAALGSIPVLGDVFSIWFRSNARNARLLERYAAQGRRRTAFREWVLIAAIIAAALIILTAALIGVGLLARHLWQAL